MSRKTLILREDQFNEICGTNTAYLDNSGDYKEDGTVTTKTAGAVSDSNGEKKYSEPITTDDYAHTLAPETLFALLFRNGGHGLWGHWGSGLRAKELTEEITPADDVNVEEEIYYKALNCLRKTDFRYDENLPELIEDAMEILSGQKQDSLVEPKEVKWYEDADITKAAEMVARLVMKKIDYEYYWEQYTGTRLPGLDESKKKIQESNSELEGRSWNGNSYTNLTTKKTELKKQLSALVQQNAPEEQIKRVKAAYMGVCSILSRETGAIKGRKTAMKNLGFNNQFQKPGGKKDSGNGKAHSKKTKDPNVGTGYITYA